LSLQLSSETFLILRRIERDIIKMHIDLHIMYPFFGPILTKLEFSRQIFEKYSNVKFHENPSGGSRVVSCGRTDKVTLKVAFRNFVNALKNGLKTV